jgi:hypothetical protein
LGCDFFPLTSQFSSPHIKIEAELMETESDSNASLLGFEFLISPQKRETKTETKLEA